MRSVSHRFQVSFKFGHTSVRIFLVFSFFFSLALSLIKILCFRFILFKIIVFIIPNSIFITTNKILLHYACDLFTLGKLSNFIYKFIIQIEENIHSFWVFGRSFFFSFYLFKAKFSNQTI